MPLPPLPLLQPSSVVAAYHCFRCPRSVKTFSSTATIQSHRHCCRSPQLLSSSSSLYHSRTSVATTSATITFVVAMLSSTSATSYSTTVTASATTVASAAAAPLAVTVLPSFAGVVAFATTVSTTVIATALCLWSPMPLSQPQPSVRTLADSKLEGDYYRGSASLEHYRGSLLQIAA
ncbi:hypothetical protein B296_00038717 [Ensete ventricosum]|uniref:Uncharacterized protein n=1 Tax=Ensete ventricosum TaxID=4639 RepID=A0A426X235_ENSVE|nr:hypothetical protein B296_00038717 [Ensete ventricosum]